MRDALPEPYEIRETQSIFLIGGMVNCRLNFGRLTTNSS